MPNFGSEWANVGSAMSAQTQQNHDAAMAATAEHLRAGNDALPRHGVHWRRVVVITSLAVLVFAGSVLFLA